MKHKYKFGIELEGYIHEDNRYDFESAISSLPYEIDDDGSIDTPGYDYEDIEVKCDRPLNYTDLCKSVKELTKHMKDNGVRVNKSCGYHLHMSNKAFFKGENVEKIVKLWVSIEDILYATQPASRLTNTYCEPRLRRFVRDEGIKLPKGKRGLIDHVSGEGRYYSLNLSALDDHETLECRLHAGTIKSEAVLNWVDLIIAIYEYALSNNYDKLVIQELFTMPLSMKKVRYTFALLKLPTKLQAYFIKKIKNTRYAQIRTQRAESIAYLNNTIANFNIV